MSEINSSSQYRQLLMSPDHKNEAFQGNNASMVCLYSDPVIHTKFDNVFAQYQDVLIHIEWPDQIVGQQQNFFYDQTWLRKQLPSVLRQEMKQLGSGAEKTRWQGYDIMNKV